MHLILFERNLDAIANGFRFPEYIPVCSLCLKQEVKCLFEFSSKMICVRCLTDPVTILGTLSTTLTETVVCTTEKLNCLEIPRGSLAFPWNALFIQMPKRSSNFHKGSPCPDHSRWSCCDHAHFCYLRGHSHLLYSLCYDWTRSPASIILSLVNLSP